MTGKFILKDATKPKGIVQTIENSYWLCQDGDPTKALFYQPYPKSEILYPQCNPNEEICKMMTDRSQYKELRAVSTWIPVAFSPWK